ncbi:non-homologous end-joining DNA ligase [Devosia sp. A16]|uniref:non-homologous end-joining DNA ligase n=1 Tax=Devosia sp. A16 TaxID=1736675 RepID=UPI0009EA9DD0
MPAVKAALRTKRPSRRDSESTPLVLPQFRPPQLATLERRVPTGDNWLFEMKLDGYRMQAAIAGDQVRLYTRKGHDWTRQFGYVAPALSRLTKGTALIDGELCAIDEHGRTNFTLLKNSLDGHKPVVFYAFDLLEQDGEDLAPLPQLERKARLEALLSDLPDDAPIAYSDHIVGDGEAVFRAMCEGGHEGVIAKAINARYYGGDRSTAWQKIKCVQRQEFVVIGWRPPEYGVDNVRGLFLATYEDGKLVYRGGVGTGFTDKLRRDVWEVLQLIRTDERPPVVGMPRTEMRVARWVEPRLLAEVEYTEITPDGLIRHPSFKGLREDKPASEVHLEEAEDAHNTSSL